MKNIVKELLPYVIILVSVILIRTFIITPVIVSGDSMKPNLHNGELLFERKIGYSGSSIKRFDIVVIRGEKEELIKRTIEILKRDTLSDNNLLDENNLANLEDLFSSFGDIMVKDEEEGEQDESIES